MDMWTCGRVRVWACGRVGVWACGHVGRRTCGHVGRWAGGWEERMASWTIRWARMASGVAHHEWTPRLGEGVDGSGPPVFGRAQPGIESDGTRGGAMRLDPAPLVHSVPQAHGHASARRACEHAVRLGHTRILVAADAGLWHGAAHRCRVLGRLAHRCAHGRHGRSPHVSGLG